MSPAATIAPAPELENRFNTPFQSVSMAMISLEGRRTFEEESEDVRLSLNFTTIPDRVLGVGQARHFWHQHRPPRLRLDEYSLSFGGTLEYMSIGETQVVEITGTATLETDGTSHSEEFKATITADRNWTGEVVFSYPSSDSRKYDMQIRKAS